MTQQILFLQGGGEGAYAEDKKLADSLQAALGSDYHVNYPKMANEDQAEYETWEPEITKALNQLGDGESMILVGHSLGGVYVLQYLAEEKIDADLKGVFLVSMPYFGAKDWTFEDPHLSERLAGKFPASVPVYLYHGSDDDFVPVSHMKMYADKLPKATAQELSGSHQVNNDLSAMAADIRKSQG
jgi:predicted alpha/beta hydrolase family esterase